MKNWKVILWLLVFHPVGLYLMYKNKIGSEKVRYTITGVFLLIDFFFIIGGLFYPMLLISSVFMLLMAFLSLVMNIFRKEDKKPSFILLAVSIVLIGLSSLPIAAQIEAEEQAQAQAELVAQQEEQDEKLEEARVAVVEAEAKKTRESYNDAKDLVDALDFESTEVSDFRERLQLLNSYLTKEEKFDQAERALKKAEEYPTEKNYQEAKKLLAEVDLENTDFEERLAEVQRIVEAEKEKKEELLALLKTAEENKDRESYEAAKALFASLLFSDLKLENRLADLEKKIILAEKEREAISGELKVHYINVGQGDSTLIELPNDQHVLIDAGTRGNGQTVSNYLNSLNISKIDYLIATHPHEDHIGGLVQIIRNYSIGKIFMPRVSHTTIVYEDLLQAISDKGYSISSPEVGSMLFEETSLSMNVLAPHASMSGSNLNDYSIANRLVFGETSFLFTGDAEIKSEQNMVNSGLNLSADVLKVGHHGGDTSSISSFLSAVNPDYGIISAGKDNQYGHPHANVMNRLADHGIETFRTDYDGTIVATSDGKNITFDKKATAIAKTPSESSTSNDSAPVEETEEPVTSNEEQGEVYGTNTGSKYHRSSCRYVKKSKIGMTQEEASNKGLEPCKVCKP